MQPSSTKLKALVLVSLSITLSLFLFNTVWADTTESAAGDGINAPAAVPTLPPLYTYLSTQKDVSVGGVSAKDEDIVRYDSGENSWSLFFDGSDVGVAKNDVDAFDLLPDSGAPLGYVILLSFEKKFSNFPGIGEVQPTDILKFTPTIIGPSTAGSFSMWLVGATVGLSGSDENIDAIALDPAGRLVISTRGNVSAPGVTAKREDLIVRTGSAWALYLDGSAIALTKSAENVMGAWIDPTGDQNIYLSTKGKYSAASGGYVATGDSDDIFGVSPGAAAPPIVAGALFAHFDGDTVGLNSTIDDFFISFSGVTVTSAASVSSAAVADEENVAQFDVVEDATTVDDEADVDEADDATQEEAGGTATRLFLPTVFH